MTRHKTPSNSTAASAHGRTFDRTSIGRTFRALDEALAKSVDEQSIALPTFQPSLDVLQVLPRHNGFFVFWNLSSRTISRASVNTPNDTSTRLVLRFYLDGSSGERNTETIPIERWRDTMNYTPRGELTGLSAVLGLDYGHEFIVLLQSTPIQTPRHGPANGRILKSEEKINVFGKRSVETVEWTVNELPKHWLRRGLAKSVEPIVPPDSTGKMPSKSRQTP